MGKKKGKKDKRPPAHSGKFEEPCADPSALPPFPWAAILPPFEPPKTPRGGGAGSSRGSSPRSKSRGSSRGKSRGSSRGSSVEAPPPFDPEVAFSKAGLAMGRKKVGEAESLYREALEGFRTSYGYESLRAAACMEKLADALRAQRKFDEAEPLLREVCEIRASTLPEGIRDPTTLDAATGLAETLTSQEKYNEATPLLHDLLESNRQSLGETHPVTLFSLNKYAECLRRADMLDEALPLYREALRGKRATMGPTHTSTIATACGLRSLLLKQGDRGSVALLEGRMKCLPPRDVKTPTKLYWKTAEELPEPPAAAEARVSILPAVDVLPVVDVLPGATRAPGFDQSPSVKVYVRGEVSPPRPH